MLKIAEGYIPDPNMSAVYNTTLLHLVQTNEDIVLLENDLGRANGTYHKVRPFIGNRYVDCGIQEANMIGVANGLSSAGMIPFAHGFASYISRKAADQVYLTGCFARQNVKMFGSDPGVMAEKNGASHMALEDMGIFLNYPNLTLVEPCDSVQLKFVIETCAKTYGMFYIRYNRKEVVKIYEEGSEFQFGKANIVRDGSDATIIASGIEVFQALKAADILKAENINVRVVDMFTWKPLDNEMIQKCAEETSAIVVAENHNCRCGLGSAVSKSVCQSCPVPMEFIGIQDDFGQVGPLSFHLEEYQLADHFIADAVRRAIHRKK